jgi:hypothetical protein
MFPAATTILPLDAAGRACGLPLGGFPFPFAVEVAQPEPVLAFVAHLLPPALFALACLRSPLARLEPIPPAPQGRGLPCDRLECTALVDRLRGAGLAGVAGLAQALADCPAAFPAPGPAAAANPLQLVGPDGRPL